jgi:hypothetical protein
LEDSKVRKMTHIGKASSWRGRIGALTNLPGQK